LVWNRRMGDTALPWSPLSRLSGRWALRDGLCGSLYSAAGVPDAPYY
jgi:hypothetical protein